MSRARGWIRIPLSLLALIVVSGCGVTAAGATPTPGAAAAVVEREGASGASSVSASPGPTATAAPLNATAAAAACFAGGDSGPFLETNGTSLTCAGNPVPLTGFTFYPALIGGARAWHDPNFPAYIDHVLDMGAAAGQNLIRATDQWDKHVAGQTADDPIVWSNMDYLMTAARKRGVFVVVDLSAFRWLLYSQGADPSRTDLWTSFATKVATRYRNNPVVAYYSISGEPTPPANNAQFQTLLDFYTATSRAIRAADPNHMISAGGFNHMEDHPELGWWQAVDALPDNDVVSVKTYSQHDLDLMPSIATYGRSVGKPIVEDEFGMPQGYGDGSFAGGAAYNGLSTGRAPFFESVYTSGRTLGFAGFIFWNMGCQMGSTSYEVSPMTAAAWSVVVRNGAVTPAASTSASRSLCP